MRTLIVGLLSAAFLFTSGCTQTPPESPRPVQEPTPATAPTGAHPGPAASTPSPEASDSAMSGPAASLVRKYQDESALEFTLPGGLDVEVTTDDDLMLSGGTPDLVAVIKTGDDREALFRQTVDDMRKAGGDSFKANKPRDHAAKGVHGKMQGGRMVLAGKPVNWTVWVFDAGKKPLRVAMYGPDLERNARARALIDSIRSAVPQARDRER